MKTFKTIFMLLFSTSLILGSCSSDDSCDVDDEIIVLPCDNSPQNLLVLSTLFDDSPSAIINYNSYGINNIDSSMPNSQGNFTTNTDLTYQLPTSTSFYNTTNNLHGIFVTRAGKYFTYNTDTGTGGEFAVPTDITAPVEINNSSYVIEVSNSGYANHGPGNHYDIKSFNINTGAPGTTVAIDPLTKDFNNNSFFHVESMSATTNGNDELYFLSGANLVTVNTTNNTASHVDLYPSFSQLDYVRFYGLEYSESLGLIAIMDDTDIHTQHIVQLDLSTGNHTNLLTIPYIVNSEFYSTAYRECDQTYYLTSLSNSSSTIETIYNEFDLTTNTVSNSQVFSDYAFGIELMP